MDAAAAEEDIDEPDAFWAEFGDKIGQDCLQQSLISSSTRKTCVTSMRASHLFVRVMDECERNTVFKVCCHEIS